MKRVRITMGKVGLVFKNRNYQRVLQEGAYWIGLREHVVVCDRTVPFKPPVDLNLLIQDEQLAALMHVIEVRDNEIALQFENGNFKQVLNPGRYTFWKGVIDYTFIKADLTEAAIAPEFKKEILTRREVLPFVRVFAVESFEKGLLFINGEFKRELAPGTFYFWRNAEVVNVLKADLRQQKMEVTGQEILTSDKAAVRMNFNIQFRVVNMQKALIENKDFEQQLYVIAQMGLREFVGTLTLDELLDKKMSVTEYVMGKLEQRSEDLGVSITNCGIKDIILPGEVKEIMNQVLIAQKRAQANVITRREETASTRSLLNTAKLMEDNPMLFKMKEMEYVEKIAEKINSISVSGGNQVVDQLRQIFS